MVVRTPRATCASFSTTSLQGFAGQDKSVLLRIMESNKRKLAVKGGVAKDKLLYPVRRSPLGRLGAGPSPKNLVSIRSRDLTGEVLCRTDVLQNV